MHKSTNVIKYWIYVSNDSDYVRPHLNGNGANDGIIHFVDDEPDIVRIAKEALQKNGFSVHAFTDSSDAINCIRNCKEKTSMLITDLRMPEFSGFDIAREARAIKPDVPIVFITAFEINDIEFEKVFPSIEINEFLQKPFSIHDLSSMIK